MLACVVLADKWRRIGIVPAAGLVVVGYAVALAAPFVYGFNMATVVPICAVILALASADTRGYALGCGDERPNGWVRSRSVLHLEKCASRVIGWTRAACCSGHDNVQSAANPPEPWSA